MKMSVKLQSLYQCALFLNSLKRLHCSLEFSSRIEHVTLFQGIYAKKRQGLVELVSSVLKLAVMVRGVIFPKHTKRFTNHNNQSEQIELFKRRGFVETGTKRSIADRLRREELQQ